MRLETLEPRTLFSSPNWYTPASLAGYSLHMEPPPYAREYVPPYLMTFQDNQTVYGRSGDDGGAGQYVWSRLDRDSGVIYLSNGDSSFSIELEFDTPGRGLATIRHEAQSLTCTFWTTNDTLTAVHFVEDSRFDPMPTVVLRHGRNGAVSYRSILENGEAGTSTMLHARFDHEWQFAGAGNFTGGSTQQLVWRNVVTGDQCLVQLTSATSLGTGWLPRLQNPNWSIGAVVDLNADGTSDLVFHNRNSGQNVVWLMDGIRIRSKLALPTTHDLSWQLVASGDINADGKPDLLWRNDRTGRTTAWLMNSTRLAGFKALPPTADPLWRLCGAADYDRDGDSDLLWRHAQTGRTSLWIMNGPSIDRYALLPPDTLKLT